ncbi:MAG: acyltransferase [Cyclobacteriaceae bacterium]|nr:acyltransferase [Cyclobacteriaceae bacterium]
MDSARGIAAILVLVFHSVLRFSETDENLLPTSYFFQHYFDLGKIAVTLFFFISGFVIPYSIDISSGRRAQVTKKFTISRFFRLYPVFWLSAILAFIIYRNRTLDELIINFTMIPELLGARPSIGVYWTLQIELIFYFFVLIIFTIGKLDKIRFLFITSLFFLVLSLVIGLLRGLLEVKLPLALPLALSLMFFGSYYRHNVLDDDKKAKTYSTYYFLLFILLIPIISILGYNIDLGHHETWYKYTTTYYVGFAMFFVITKIKWSGSILEYFGKISYSVYLFHPLLIYQIGNTSSFQEFPGILKMGMVLVSTIMFSHVTYNLVEKPAQNIGRSLKNRVV